MECGNISDVALLREPVEPTFNMKNPSLGFFLAVVLLGYCKKASWQEKDEQLNDNISSVEVDSLIIIVKIDTR